MYRYLFHRNLIYSSLVASALEGSGEELRQYLVSLMIGDEATRHDEHVGIVVLACQAGNLRIPAQGGTDALMLVQCDADAVSAAADGNAGIALTGFYGERQRMGEVRIVYTLGGVGAEIFVLPALCLEPLLYVLFQFISGMVGTDSYRFHNIAFTWLYTFSAVKPNFSSSTL